MEEDKKQELENEQEEAPTLVGGLKGIAVGLAILGLAYYFYITMTSYENGEGIRMNRLLLLLYGFLGKSITAGIVGIIGLFTLYSGVKEITESQKS